MQPVCKHCGQPVWGRYITALGATWHPEHFLCAGCGQPLGGGEMRTSQAGQPYHTACYLAAVAPRCGYCGHPISDSYVEHEGQAYHTVCFREHVIPRCVYCQKPLADQYLVDAWGSAFCREHEGHYPQCSFCGRLIPPQEQTSGWNIYDSQRCTICRSTAIEAVEQAQPLFQQLKQWIGQQGFRFHQLPLRLELWNRARLTAMLRGRSEIHPLGITLSSSRTQNGHVLDTRIDGVAVLQGMPATLFAGVVLHELGHVWLTVHAIDTLPLWAEEGFCQLLSHRYYNALGTPEARYRASSIEKESDHVYGEGFRRVHTLSEQMGFAQLMQALQSTKHLPGA